MPRCMQHESCTILIFLAYRVSAKAYGFAVLVRLGHKCPLLCKRDWRPLPLTRLADARLVGGYGVWIPRPAGYQPRLPISECKPEPPASSREYWLLRRKCEDAACVLHESCGIPAVAHVWKVHASLSLCRIRLAFAFDLVSPAISWKLGVWRGCDVSVPP